MDAARPLAWLAAGARPGLRDVVAAWRRGTRPLVWLGVGVAVAGTLWVALTATLMGIFGRGHYDGLLDVLRFLVASESAALFPLWLMLGGLGASLVFMLFIIWNLARESKAGRMGTFILFFVLAFGMIGFVAKTIIAKVLGI